MYKVTITIFMTLGCLLSGINTQINPSCRLIDFNNTDSVLEFEQCLISPEFILQSYLDEPLIPFRDNLVNYLTNIGPGWSCFSTTQKFRLGENTEFDTAIYLQSPVIDDSSFLEIAVFNVDDGSVIPIISAVVNPLHIWNEFHTIFNSRVDNAQIEIRAFLTVDARLAIQHLHISNPTIPEIDCRRAAVTTTDVTDTTTEEATEATTTETSNPSTETTTVTPSTGTPTPETEIPTTSEDATPAPEIEVPSCLEVDFNNSTSLVATFKECREQYLPKLIIKSYLDTSITPYRDTSLYYLSNEWEGLSCLETSSIFSLNDSSFIESAIFLNGVSPGAWIDISVVDANTGEREVLKKVEMANNWIQLSEEIKGTYNNVQIIIKTNMNAYSQLAVEYFRIRGDSC